jgi:hypothetical protein
MNLHNILTSTEQLPTLLPIDCKKACGKADRKKAVLPEQFQDLERGGTNVQRNTE